MFDYSIFILFKYSFVEVLIICLLAGIMGVFVVNYRLAFFSDAISHSAFTGVALGLLSGINPVVTVVVFGVVMGFLVIYFREKTGIAYDTVIGVFFSFSVALGIFLVSSSSGLIRNFHVFLYGDILLISNTDLIITSILLAGIVVFINLFFDDLILLGIDEVYASSQLRKAHILKYSFSMLLALVVTIAIKTVGILLVTALLVVPAAGARVISRSIRGMFFNSILISLISGISGLLLSLQVNSSTGASIVIISCMIFVLLTAYKNLSSLLT